MPQEELPIWRQPNFIKLWFSQTLNSLAHILLQVVVMVQVYQRTHSALGSAAVLALMSLSLFISGLFAAKYIDRFSMRSIIHFSGWCRALLTIIIGFFLYQNSTAGLIGLFVGIAFYSFINAWYQPARFALLPLIIPSHQYIRANGTLVMVQQLFMTAGWGIGGFLVVYVSLPVMVGMLSIFYILSGSLAYSIKLAEEKPAAKKKPVSAWKEVWAIPVVKGITIMNIIEGISHPIWTSALLLAFSTTVLKAGETWWGLLNAGYFMGAILGSIMVTFISGLMTKRSGIVVGMSGLSMGVFTILFSVNTLPLAAVLLCIAMGPLYQARDICQVAILQEAIPAERRANVMAARNTFLTPWNGLTVLFIGYLADVFGIQNTYLLAGVLYLLASIIALQQRTLRHYRINKKEDTAVKAI